MFFSSFLNEAKNNTSILQPNIFLIDMLDWEQKISESLFLWFQKVRMDKIHFHLSVP